MRIKSVLDNDFDQYADDYDRMLDEGLSISGEGKEYFARGRIDWLKQRLEQLSSRPRRIMDYGCGTGMTSPLLCERLSAERVIGVDPSSKLVERANRDHGSSGVCFEELGKNTWKESMDLVYSNGVFHHIPVEKRRMAIYIIWRSLRPGGYFALWENNPWNPGTRYIMSRTPFDDDAVPLSSKEAVSLLQPSGFHIVCIDYLFIFPHFMRILRRVEPYLAKWPLGAQYLVLARKSTRLSW